jgi:hypothetical protein
VEEEEVVEERGLWVAVPQARSSERPV